MAPGPNHLDVSCFISSKLPCITISIYKLHGARVTQNHQSFTQPPPPPPQAIYTMQTTTASSPSQSVFLKTMLGDPWALGFGVIVWETPTEDGGGEALPSSSLPPSRSISTKYIFEHFTLSITKEENDLISSTLLVIDASLCTRKKTKISNENALHVSPKWKVIKPRSSWQMHQQQQMKPCCLSQDSELTLQPHWACHIYGPVKTTMSAITCHRKITILMAKIAI